MGMNESTMVDPQVAAGAMSGAYDSPVKDSCMQGFRSPIKGAQRFFSPKKNSTGMKQRAATPQMHGVSTTPMAVLTNPVMVSSAEVSSPIEVVVSPASPASPSKFMDRVKQRVAPKLPPSPPASPQLNRMRKGDMPEPRVPQFEISEKIIGEGAFAKVRLATNVHTGQKAAVKSFPIKPVMTKEQEEDLKMIRKEQQLLQQLNHQNIVKLYHSEEDSSKISLYLQYVAGGDMYNWLCEKGKVPEKSAKALFRQMLDAVDFCHQNGICHRDIKLENFLLDGSRPVLIDFGFASPIPADGIFRDFPGSPAYACPEILLGTAYQGTAADVYAMGVVLFTMLYYKYPFYSENRKQMASMVAYDELVFPGNVYTSLEVRDLMSKLLQKRAGARPTIAEIRAHPWLQEESSVSTLLKQSAASRVR